MTEAKTSYPIVGLMSGTSLDGLDIAFCCFTEVNGRWEYTLGPAETIPYNEEWISRLSNLERGTAFEFAATDIGYGHLLGRLAGDFISRHNLKPLFIASHGHTIFHQPGLRITSQIGRGSAIAAESGLPVVCDFRALDVALGGQGAPLVPIGDRHLFGQFAACLNLGGFANISYDEGPRRIAFDVCPANIVLNHLARLTGHPYDDDGQLSRKGVVNTDLLDSLNALPFYAAPPPRSLGKEWVLEHIHPLLASHEIPVYDQLATFTEHIAIQVAAVTGNDPGQNLLVTGGGAFNTHLINRIQAHSALRVVVPDPLTINYKEALIFALLGLLRWRGENNCLQTVTGATSDNCGGVVCLPGSR